MRFLARGFEVLGHILEAWTQNIEALTAILENYKASWTQNLEALTAILVFYEVSGLGFEVLGQIIEA